MSHKLWVIITKPFSRLESGSITNRLFVEAENSIRDLLRYDSYRRFLKSNNYKWIEAQISINPKITPIQLREIVQSYTRYYKIWEHYSNLGS